MGKRDIKSLKKRYLVWFYKQTKDALDKVERKFTQAQIDRFILKELKDSDSEGEIKNYIDEFEKYILQKEKSAAELKYDNSEIRPEHLYLTLKLQAIEKAVKRELGRSALKRIKDAYEKEMLKRILEERQEKL